ncbi:hypothetical protein ACTMQ2_10585 [Pseudomonas syringae pv. aptata]|uniref:Uncharacterized protein n=1 Tax=Pseudomonas syringae pv. maculicola str. ES4326 TaxID=629265 RepID=A0A8T8BWA1_PSEYM|nr:MULTISPECIES: hypothetical protein [Pseudomonas syringae group]MCK0549984.1 hypothetical protein [Pseudomonas syringae pv. aptata]QHE95274.1 hypothetical protein PMA4326_000555 [Pseudomonas syringae pv. maculicola str. ES4326]UBY95904.1 hypothetical protein LCG56_18080 [Pseudomonas cannabina pv. alisalensis]
MDINWPNEVLRNIELAEDLIGTVFAISSEKIHMEAWDDKKSISHWRHLMTIANNDLHSLRVEKNSAVEEIVEDYRALSKQLMHSAD